MGLFNRRSRDRETNNRMEFQRAFIRFHFLFALILGFACLAALTSCSSMSGNLRSASNPQCLIVPSPAAVTVTAGTQLPFTASSCGATGPSGHWAVNGIAAGNSTYGTITANGLYTAPTVNPGMAASVSLVNLPSSASAGASTVTIVNPPPTPFQGATYAGTVQGWNASLLPWIEELSGLTWNPTARTWTATAGWTVPAQGIAPNVYYLEEAIRPATRMAIVHQDIPFMEELAMFHVALLELRTTTIGNLLQNAPPNSVIFIDGAPSDRTFAWFEPYSATQVRIRDYQLGNAQYLSTAARLLRAIAQMPAGERTEPLLIFVQQYSSFLVSEQLLRLMYGSTAWSHWDNPNIPQPVVSAWTFLAATGYRPPDPIKFEAAMTDMELWLVADSAEALAANQAAPELNILDSETQSQLQQAVTAGVSLMQARCPHAVAPDGADVLSLFAGDYDDYIDYAYAGATAPSQPTAPDPKTGLSWDISHSYRFPVVFRSLYETRSATGASFPTMKDMVALGNTYTHLAFNGNSQLPAFNNFVDGWNGWFGVEQADIPNGYPPYQDCQAQQSNDNCLIPGAVQGWGELGYLNPSVASLSQALIDLAYDDSGATAAFKNQHYYYVGQPYSANAGVYPQLMVYVAADSAELLQ